MFTKKALGSNCCNNASEMVSVIERIAEGCASSLRTLFLRSSKASVCA